MANYDFTYTGAEIQAILDTAKKLKDSGYIFLGVATPSTNPGTPTQKVYYEAKQAGTYTNFGGVVLPDGISLLIWNGSWTSETVMCGDGGVFDISVYKSSGGTLAKYTDLAAALGTNGANIPQSLRKGGMSVKFVQSSDNKYVQYRLMADSWSIDTDDWSFCGDNVLVDNPEYIAVYLDADGRILKAVKNDGTEYFAVGVETQTLKVHDGAEVHGDITTDVSVITMVENPEFLTIWLDKDNKILFGIQNDGNFYFGCGVPQQVIDYVEGRIEDLSLDEYEDIVAFLGDLITGDNTLAELLNEKVDKEEGKSLIDEEYAEGVRYIENPEFAEVKMDNEDRILEAIMKDGTKLLPAGVKVIGTVEYDGATIKTIENPEFAGVWLDGEDKILFGVEQDGNFLFGCGVPKQVKEYIEQKIEELSLDEYESIVAFIGDYLNNTTLEELLSKKVDGEYVENPEFIEAKIDAEDKVLEGIQKDGTKVIGGDLRVFGNMEISGISYKVIENPEYLVAWVDAENKVIFGLKTDGKTYVGDADFLNNIKNNQEAISEINATIASISSTIESLDIDALTSITATENPEFIEVELDAESKVLSGRKTDGTKFENNDVELNCNATIGGSLEIDGVVIKNIEDSEGRSEITTDSEGKIISYRDADGVKHEEIGIETPHIELIGDGIDDLGKALKEGGYGNMVDWSDEELVEIPIPEVCAIVNFGVDSQATSKSDKPDFNPGVNGEIPTYLEFWDKQGNYFKKPILLSAQGSSSMYYWIKNQGFDLDDGSSIKFGNWVAQDSFHVKKYYIDVFRGQSIVGYWLTEQVYQTRNYGEKRPWDYMNQGGDTVGAIGKFNQDFDTGALAHPDGFPVHVFFNGKDAGIYSFNLKKHRDNYYVNKKNTNNIILDGEIGGRELFNGTIKWTSFEIRNPKPKASKDGWELVDVDGHKYDGDFPKELMGTTTPGYDSTNLSHVKSAQTKAVIERLASAQAAIRSTMTKETFEEYFNVDFFIDYFLVSQVIWNQDGFWKNWIWCTWDGLLWTPTSYDMDSIFGMLANGTGIVPAGEYQLPSADVTAWTNTNTLLGVKQHVVSLMWTLYTARIRARYKELRDAGIFTTDNIVNLMEKWVNKVGYDNLKNDIENICAYEDVPQTPSYRDGSETYSQYPEEGGFYNSILRVKRWLDEHFAYLDSEHIMNYNHYNQN